MSGRASKSKNRMAWYDKQYTHTLVSKDFIFYQFNSSPLSFDSRELRTYVFKTKKERTVRPILWKAGAARRILQGGRSLNTVLLGHHKNVSHHLSTRLSVCLIMCQKGETYTVPVIKLRFLGLPKSYQNFNRFTSSTESNKVSVG